MRPNCPPALAARTVGVVTFACSMSLLPNAAAQEPVGGAGAAPSAPSAPAAPAATLVEASAGSAAESARPGGRGEGESRRREEGDEEWECAPGERYRSREGDGRGRIETWYCRPGEPLQIVVGLIHRGVVSETGSFSDKLGFEAALRLWSRLDLGAAVGQVFKEKAKLAADVRTRLFLFKLPSTGGPYLGGGWKFTDPREAYLTLGLFGGSGFFYELQFRGSDKQPVAVIPAMGLRLAFP